MCIGRLGNCRAGATQHPARRANWFLQHAASGAFLRESWTTSQAVSELTTNAVLRAPSDTAKFRASLTYWAIHVVVTDRGQRKLSRAKSETPDDESGRELDIVKALADQFELRYAPPDPRFPADTMPVRDLRSSS
ncbi:ATP-binding protein [Streptomyces sp. NEAU-174]|uniref:ATP-binding protein n=1 Tax=Streptomyces sp. NEAU-174 TaxID=3458254 RepID=UPI004043D4B0